MSGGATIFRDYVLRLSRLMSKEAEITLPSKLVRSRKLTRIERKFSDRSMFGVKAYIILRDVNARSPLDVPELVLTVSNSAAIIRDGDVLGIFLRLGGVNFSRTFIAYTEVPILQLRGKVSVDTRTVLYPLLSSECVEDPRVDPEDPTSLFHVRAYYMPSYSVEKLVMTFCALLSMVVRYLLGT
ncbi:MAG: hypothetical protein DRJ40_11330 [Thermoprotei archaeon]|nr:MAG: hypothetical protein DRJ40_11330 [Thermoprotei archaeon]